LLAKPLPIMAGFFLFFVLGSLGLPGLSGFVGEFLSLLGLFAFSHWLAAIAATGVILAAVYLLWMFQRTMFNDRGDEDAKPSFSLRDLGAREILTLIPLVVLVIWVGVHPNTFLQFLHVPVREILDKVTPSLQSAQAHGLTRLFDVTKGLF
jgi:NADH-quinone oxidoreductase subunit M